MEFKIECPWCNQHYSVDESFVGQRVECSVCEKDFVVKYPNDSISTTNIATANCFSQERETDNRVVSCDYNAEEKAFLSKRTVRKRFITISVLAFVLIPLCFFCYKISIQELASNSLKKGKMSFDKHRYEDAVNCFQKAAKYGHPDAQLMLGMCYFNGDGIKRDYDEAVKWFRRAAEQNSLQAQFKLGVCYMGGIGVNRREDEALYWLQKAAEHGNLDAQIYLGDFYYDRGKTLENFSKALTWYQNASETGLITDESKAKMLMCKTFQEAYNGDATAQLAVYLAYKGELFGIKQDDNEANKWLILAANSGNPKAQGLLGASLMEKGDEDEALKWLEKAGEQEDVRAMLLLAAYYTDKAKKESIRGDLGSLSALAHSIDLYREAEKWINKLRAIDAKSSED